MRVDVRHSDDRGLQSLAGVVVIFILTRLWLSGDLASWLAMITGWFRGAESYGPSSATYAIIELLTSLVYGVGTVAILAWSGVSWLFRDIVAAVRMIRERGQAEVPAAEAIPEAKQEAASDDPIVDAIATLADAVSTLMERMDVNSERISVLSDTVNMRAKPAPKTTARRANG